MSSFGADVPLPPPARPSLTVAALLGGAAAFTLEIGSAS